MEESQQCEYTQPSPAQPSTALSPLPPPKTNHSTQPIKKQEPSCDRRNTDSKASKQAPPPHISLVQYVCMNPADASRPVTLFPAKSHTYITPLRSEPNLPPQIEECTIRVQKKSPRSKFKKSKKKSPSIHKLASFASFECNVGAMQVVDQSALVRSHLGLQVPRSFGRCQFVQLRTPPAKPGPIPDRETSFALHGAYARSPVKVVFFPFLSCIPRECGWSVLNAKIPHSCRFQILWGKKGPAYMRLARSGISYHWLERCTLSARENFGMTGIQMGWSKNSNLCDTGELKIALSVGLMPVIFC